MCGIVGVFGHSPVSQVIYDSLSMLQHRGQDAAGIATFFEERFYLHKGNGLITEVFDAGNMARLLGTMGIGHVRYPTAGCASVAEAQPFYVNSPYGIVFAHNGNLTNVADIVESLFVTDMRHLNTTSDSEVMLNVFAHALTRRGAVKPNEFDIFAAVEEVHRRCKGGYAVVTMVAGVGMIAFRDLHGIRPLILGSRIDDGRTEYMIASESVALQVAGFSIDRDLAPGETVYIDMEGQLTSHVSLLAHEKAPCLFEYVYLARPDSVLDGASVYEARINMGTKLAAKIKREWPDVPIDVVVPIPSTSRVAAQEIATRLNIPYRDALVRNRYVGRTFIMPGQAQRKQSIRRKLNPIPDAFRGKNILLVDDSIVRGTTSKKIVEMVRAAGAKEVHMRISSPPTTHSCFYGIDTPERSKLLASSHSVEEMAALIGADSLAFISIDGLYRALGKPGRDPDKPYYCDACFTGDYPIPLPDQQDNADRQLSLLAAHH
jgi:amidophosphoribosyltransferase